MRLWSLHPQYLDRAGLTAAWRESLLAQAVLAGRTTGYRNHPQLERFRATADPLGAIAHYLDAIADEADRRGYAFNRGRIDDVTRWQEPLTVATGQVAYELAHLRRKLEQRAPERVSALPATAPTLHPSFTLIGGPVASWERTEAR